MGQTFAKYRIAIVVSLLAVLIVFFVFSKLRPKPEVLFPVVVKDKVGYITKTGKMYLSPRFVTAGEFSEGLAPAKESWEDGVFGYIDTRGSWQVKPQFTKAGLFSDGLACVSSNGKYGFIDKYGTMGIPATFTAPSFFQEGRAPMRESTDTWGFIDRTGAWVIEAKYEFVGPFFEGLAVFRRKGEDLYGYLDKDGRVVIEPEYGSARGFRDGVAAVRKKNGRWGFIDQRNNALTDFQYSKLGNGRQAFFERDGRRGFLTLQGSQVDVWSLDGLDYGGDFQDHLALASQNERYGYILSTDRSWKIPPQFSGGSSFYHGMALVGVSESTYGYIDREGKLVFQAPGAMHLLTLISEKRETSWSIVGHGQNEL